MRRRAISPAFRLKHFATVARSDVPLLAVKTLRLSVRGSSHLLDAEHRKGSRERAIAEYFADRHISVEIDLPIVIVVAVRTDCENGTRGRERSNNHVGLGLGNNIGDLLDAL